MQSQGHMGAPLYHDTDQITPSPLDLRSQGQLRSGNYVTTPLLRLISTSDQSYIHIRHTQSVWGIGLLCQGSMGAPLYHTPAKLDTVLVSQVTWGVEMMTWPHGWDWYSTQTTSYNHIRHIQSVWGIGLMSQEKVGAPLYHYRGQVCTRFGKSG